MTTKPSEETLTEALRSLGIGHRRNTTKAGQYVGRHVLFNMESGEELPGTFSAQDGWDLVHERRGDQ